MPTYAQNKKHIIAYTEANKDKVREITKKWQCEHSASVAKAKSKYYYYHKEVKRLSNILLD